MTAVAKAATAAACPVGNAQVAGRGGSRCPEADLAAMPTAEARASELVARRAHGMLHGCRTGP